MDAILALRTDDVPAALTAEDVPRTSGGRGARAPHADAVHAHDLRARGRDGRAQGGEPAALRSFKVRGVAASSRRWARGLGRRRRRRIGRQPRPGGRRGRREHGIACEVFVPLDAPMPRSRRPRPGRDRARRRRSVDECVELARERAETRRARVRAPVRRPGRSSPARARSGSSCSRTCRTSPASCPRRRRRAVLGHGDRDQGGAAGGRGDRRAGRRLRALPRVAAPRRAGAGRLRAHDRRRHRGQAPGRADARAAAAPRRRDRRRGRGRDRRGDGAADGARQARGRGRRRGRRRRIARRPGRRRRRRHDDRGALRRQRRRGPAGRRSRGARRPRPAAGSCC